MVFRNKAVSSELLDEDVALAVMIIPTSIIQFEIRPISLLERSPVLHSGSRAP